MRQMKHTGILLTLVAALLFVACRTDNTSIQLLDQAETLMNAAPDTALALLDSIDSHRLGRADNARYALLRSQALASARQELHRHHQRLAHKHCSRLLQA